MNFDKKSGLFLRDSRDRVIEDSFNLHHNFVDPEEVKEEVGTLDLDRDFEEGEVNWRMVIAIERHGRTRRDWQWVAIRISLPVHQELTFNDKLDIMKMFEEEVCRTGMMIHSYLFWVFECFLERKEMDPSIEGNIITKEVDQDVFHRFSKKNDVIKNPEGRECVAFNYRQFFLIIYRKKTFLEMRQGLNFKGTANGNN